jgi:hypothetical protein
MTTESNLRAAEVRALLELRAKTFLFAKLAEPLNKLHVGTDLDALLPNVKRMARSHPNKPSGELKNAGVWTRRPGLNSWGLDQFAMRPPTATP